MPTNQITSFDRPTAVALSREIESALREIAEILLAVAVIVFEVVR